MKKQSNPPPPHGSIRPDPPPAPPRVDHSELNAELRETAKRLDWPRHEGIQGFNYVDVGCEGRLNLFHNDDIVCLVRVVSIADEIRETAQKRHES